MAPVFGNVGRAARSLFDIGYDVLDGFRLDVNTYKKLGISAGGIQRLESGDVVTSYFETRYTLNKFNCLIFLAERWTMNHNMTTEATIVGLLPGFTLTTSGIFDCQNHSKGVDVKTEYKNDHVSLILDTKFKEFKPIIHASAVASYNGLWGGFHVKYNANQKVLKYSNLSLSYKAGKFVLTTAVNDKNLFSGSIINKCSKRLNVGLHVIWSSINHGCLISVGSKYQFNKAVKLRAKIVNVDQLYLGSEIQVKKGVKLTFASLFVCRQFNLTDHTFGIGLELNL
ncbi:voltage-dependent anion-selective channel-like isoform X2 [Rhopalosiphum maidis]|nr:voltage-dependent anion-selective channel-like isoform X2 [Rhopalosiphum maidis]